MVPTVILILTIIIYPILNGLWLSTTDKQLLTHEYSFIGLKNFTRLFRDNLFWVSMWHNLIWSALGTLGSILLGLALALFFNQKLKGVGIFRALLMLPWITPGIGAAIIWQYLYNDHHGWIAFFLKETGLSSGPINLLGNTRIVLYLVIIPLVWRGFPLAMLALTAALKSVPKELYEAASVDGANTWEKFISITVPVIRPTLAILTLLDIIWIFNYFDLTYALTQGGPLHASELLSTFSYKTAFLSLEAGYASSISTIMFLILLILASIYLRYVYIEE